MRGQRSRFLTESKAPGVCTSVQPGASAHVQARGSNPHVPSPAAHLASRSRTGTSCPRSGLSRGSRSRPGRTARRRPAPSSRPRTGRGARPWSSPRGTRHGPSSCWDTCSTWRRAEEGFTSGLEHRGHRRLMLSACVRLFFSGNRFGNRRFCRTRRERTGPRAARYKYHFQQRVSPLNAMATAPKRM